MINVKNPAVRIQKSRTALLLDHPFFGSLLFRLGGRSSTSIETMATDGVSLYYNPSYVETLNAAELAGVLAHEVMHPALQHHTRRGGRNPKRWNMACDYAINPLLIDAGLTLPKDVLIDHRFRGMSAEEIYNMIEEQSGPGFLNPDRGICDVGHDVTTSIYDDMCEKMASTFETVSTIGK